MQLWQVNWTQLHDHLTHVWPFLGANVLLLWNQLSLFASTLQIWNDLYLSVQEQGVFVAITQSAVVCLLQLSVEKVRLVIRFFKHIADGLELIIELFVILQPRMEH